jgi:hypothetical protein
MTIRRVIIWAAVGAIVVVLATASLLGMSLWPTR